MTLLQTPNDLSRSRIAGIHGARESPWSGGNLANAQVADLDAESVFHSWSAQSGPQAIPLAGGSGSTVWDHDGNHYLDFSSQLVFTNLGHQHPKVVAAIVEQASG